jgi:putative nucleotidyltransferase with HDIG domain
MRLISTANLKVGDIVGRALVTESGQVLLNAGIELTERYIESVRAQGFPNIYVSNSGVEETPIEADEDLDPQVRAGAIKIMRSAFDAIANEVETLRNQSFETVAEACTSDAIRDLMSPAGPFGDVCDAAKDILSDVLSRSTLAGLTSIKSVNSKMYNHSIDVCVVAIMIARSIGLDRHQLGQLAAGCLLHDIGKLFVGEGSDSITSVRRHTLLGYELLKNSPDPEILAPHVALEHHELQNGSGQPRGLLGSNTIERDRGMKPPIPTLVGEIATVANIYDNILTGSITQPPMTPDTAVQAINSASGTHLNQAIVSAFLRLVPVYPQGIEVIVRSTNEFRNFTGIVNRVNPVALDKPVILLLRDNKQNSIAPIKIDMADCEDMIIRAKYS